MHVWRLSSPSEQWSRSFSVFMTDFFSILRFPFWMNNKHTPRPTQNASQAAFNLLKSIERPIVGHAWPAVSAAAYMQDHCCCMRPYITTLIMRYFIAVYTVTGHLARAIMQLVGAKKTGPPYLIANIMKTPWPNCVEIGERLQCEYAEHSH